MYNNKKKATYFLNFVIKLFLLINNLLKKNIVIKTIVRLRAILPEKFKKQGAIVLILLLLNSLLELAGLAALIPIIIAVLQPEAFEGGLMKSLYDFSGMETTESFILALCIFIFLFIIIKNILSIQISKYQATYSYNLYRHFATKLHQYTYNQGFLFFKSENSNNIVRDINVVTIYFSQNILLPVLTILTEVSILLIIVILIILKDPKLIVMLTCLVVPIFLIFYRTVKNKIISLNKELYDLAAETNKNLFQSIFGYVDVMMNNKKEFFFDMFKTNTKDMARVRTKTYIFNLLPSKVIETTMILGVLLIVLYGVYFLPRKELLLLLGIFTLAAYKTLPSINKIMIAVMGIKGNEYVLEIIEKLRKIKPVIEEYANNKKITFNNSIQVRNLNFSYPNSIEKVLTNINFEVKKGQSVGFIGRSGSGKTTLANLLLGFLELNEGEILVDGKRLDKNTLYHWREIIGYVQQEVFLIDGTLAENIALGYGEVDLEKVNQVAQKASLRELIAELPEGLNTMVGERGSKISGGQRQRVGIARALYSGAKVLFFDEATSALDTETEDEITEAINHLADEDLTMFIIAHRHSTLKYCDFIIELKDGQMEILENKYRI